MNTVEIAKCETAIKHHQDALAQIDKNRKSGTLTPEDQHDQQWHQHALVAFKSALTLFKNNDDRGAEIHVRNGRKAAKVADKRFS